MGWASATSLFDGAVDVVLDFIPHHPETGHPEALVEAVVEAMYTRVDWVDWDTQDESKYDHYLRTVRYRLGEIELD